MSDSLFSDYYYVKVAGRCEIGGIALPISSYSLIYGMNVLPYAMIELPIGRVAGGAQFSTVSRAMEFLLSLDPFTTVKVFATFTASPAGRAAPQGAIGFPDGEEFPVFEGFIQTPAVTNTFGSASVSVRCMGKTAGLAGSTQFVRGAVAVEPANGASDALSFFGGTAQATLQDTLVQLSSGAVADLWNGIIKVLYTKTVEEIVAIKADTVNTFAQEAIDRINTFKALSSAGVLVDSSSAPNDMLARTITATALSTFFDAWAGNLNGSLWTATLDLAPLFGFKYVTAIEEDAILPVFFGLGGDPWATIEPNEYSQIQMEATTDENFYSYITQVGIFSSNFSGTPWQGTSTPTRIIGQAGLSSDLLNGFGRLLLQPAPVWLMPPGASGNGSLVPGGEVPDAANPGVVTITNDQGQKERQYFAGLLGNKYAQAVLYDKLFEHRQMNFSGRIRFDIAPGSLIRVVTAGERFTGKDAELWGHVSAVQVDVRMTDGTNGHARTKFAVTNVRSKAEHAAFTLSKHPVFNERWVGGKLSSKV